jgi:hypothetical protein
MDSTNTRRLPVRAAYERPRLERLAPSEVARLEMKLVWRPYVALP